MEYLQVRKELALELPFSSQEGQRAKKLKKDAKEAERAQDSSRNKNGLAQEMTPLSELSARELPRPPRGSEDLQAH